MCVCVCVRACVREGKRRGEGKEERRECRVNRNSIGKNEDFDVLKLLHQTLLPFDIFHKYPKDPFLVNATLLYFLAEAFTSKG